MGRSLVDQLRQLGFTPEQIARATVNGKPLATAASRVVRTQVLVLPGNPFRIIIPGEPLGKPRMTHRDKWKKRDRVMRYRAWCDRVTAAVGNALPQVDAIVALNWTAYFEPPVSWSKKKRVAAIGTIHRSKPDRDNVDKAVLDCLFKNDSGISVGQIAKYWDWNARLEIEIVTT